MKLHDVEFGCVFNASGARNLTGQGYWFHRVGSPFGLECRGSTFVAKTTTLLPRAGNMPLKEDGETPREWKPRCIVVNHRKGIALNAVGLSGPGAKRLLDSGRLQGRTDPLVLSFMSMQTTPADRAEGLRQYVHLMSGYLPTFLAPVALQINFSCPNVGLNPHELVEEVGQAMEIAGALEIPLVPKFNATVPVEPIVEISRHPNFSALCMSNTIPWGQIADRIDWLELFGTAQSPLLIWREMGCPASLFFPSYVIGFVERERPVW